MIQIRKAEIKDLLSIRDILNDQILNTCNVYDETPRSELQMIDWYQNQEKLNRPVLVAVKETQVVGYATYSQFRRWEGFRFCVEHSIYLNEESRGSGIGKSLLNELLKIAKEENIHTVIAGIDGQNQKGIDFHKTQGFEQVAEIKESGFKFGQWLDLVLMQRILK